MTKKSNDVAAADLMHSIGLLVRRVRAASAAASDLSLTEASVVAHLDREGPTTTADLARHQSMRPQSMGTTIAALEEMGLVERKPHPTDGRQVYIVLTQKGIAARKNAKDAKRTWLAQAMAKLTEEERQALFTAGEIIQRLMEK